MSSTISRKIILAATLFSAVSVTLSQSTVAAGWLFLLAALTYWKPPYGVAALFAFVSLDPVLLMPGQIWVSLSEIELMVCWAAWFGRFDFRWNQVDFRLLRWGCPFLGAVLISGLARSDWVVIAPHIIRLSELFVAGSMAASLLQKAGQSLHTRTAFGLAVLLFSSSSIWEVAATGVFRPTAFFSNPNQLAAYANLLFPPLLLLAIRRTGYEAWFWRVLLISSSYTIFLAQSRSALLALLVALLFMGLRSTDLDSLEGLPSRLEQMVRRTRRSELVPALVILTFLFGALLGVLWFPGAPLSKGTRMAVRAFLGRLQAGPLAATVSRRLPYLAVGAELWKGHLLLGVGPGNYPEAVLGVLPAARQWVKDDSLWPDFVSTVRGTHTHNLALQLGVEFGVLGVLGFAYFCWCCWRHFYRFSRRSCAALAGTGILIAFLIQNLFDVTFPSLAIEMGLLMGALIGTSDGQSQDFKGLNNDLQVAEERRTG